MADGSISVKVNVDDKQAQKELNSLEKKMQKTAQAIEQISGDKTAIEKKLEAAGNAADATREKVKQLNAELAAEKQRGAASMLGGTKTLETYESEQLQGQISARIAEQEKLLKSQISEADKLGNQYQKIEEKLQNVTAQYERQKEQAGQIRSQMMQTSGQALERVRAGIADTAQSFGSAAKNILKWGIGIRSVYILVRKLRQGLVEGFKKYMEVDPETKANVDALKASLDGLKVSLGAAFAPIVNLVTPYLQTLIGWLKTAINYLAMYYAALAGQNSYRRIISGNKDLAKSYGAAGAAAEKAEKQIMGFDEINKLNDSSSSGGGGGAGGGAGDIEYEDVALTGWAEKFKDFMDEFKINVKDVLFNWDDLSGEQIAKKAIAGLGALLGAGVGLIIAGGSLPGAIVGTLLGFTLGIAIDTLLFNNDGQIDREELAGMLVLALGALCGGAIGFFSGGGLHGALIGAAIGVGFALLIEELSFNHDGKISKTEIRSLLIKALTVLCGGIIGFVAIPGPVGALIGATIGLALVLTTKSLDASGVEKPLSEWFSSIGEKINRGWESITEIFHDKWNALKSWWQGLSLGSFPFRLPHLEVSWQELGSNSIIAQLLGISAIPHFNVAWYARGGIIDGATLIGAGEQGKEAIIPLERNTQWIRKVAEELLDAMERRYSGAMAGMPALAMGRVVPPRSISGSGYSDSLTREDLAAAMARIEGAFNSAKFEIENKLYVDGREMARVVSQHQRIEARAIGR